jgi:glyoxylase-like metal-dependent hydrolase (beta-lactamase superfamily II)
MPRRLSENLWVFEDTANVYVVRDGASCVLIDFGSGVVLDHLPELGITQVDWILHTHHHRDQCQGDNRAVELGIPIAVPAHERHLFEDAENFWRNRRVYHLYYVRNDFNTAVSNIPVAASLHDYETLQWRNIDFQILPSPGHTPGSISLLAEIDDRTVAFTGDLVHSPGKILTLHDTQFQYGGIEGVDLGAHSLLQLALRSPSLVCPSHGMPFEDADRALRETAAKLADYVRFMGASPTIDNRPYAISPHLIVSHQTDSSFYAIVSDTGRAMLIDYGAASDIAWTFEKATAPTARIRFVEHTLDQLRNDFGVTSIDVVIPSHMHDDHVNGIPHLAHTIGTQVWCLDVIAEVLEHPRGFNLGCLLGAPIGVDRVLRSGEVFSWQEFEFEIVHSPGHTEYQMALHAVIDNSRVAFTGDAFFPPNKTESAYYNVIYRNHVEHDSHLKSLDELVKRGPTLLCPGHGKPFSIEPAGLAATRARLEAHQRYFFDLLPDGAVDIGLDPSWVKIYPYQPVVAPGADLALEIRAQNYGSAVLELSVELVVPAAWSIKAGGLRLRIPARGHAVLPVAVAIPTDWAPPAARFAIAVDVHANGRHLGQIAEAICEVAGMAPNLESWA